MKQENTLELLKLKKTGSFPVQLEGEIFTAPYSKKACVWFESIYHSGPTHENGYTSGDGTRHESPVTVRSSHGDLTLYPARIMLYLSPSYEGRIIVDEEEQYVTEFCLEPDRTYYAFSEKFTYHLPPFRFLPFIPKRRTTWLLALSDAPLENGRPLQELIPARKGMTG